MAAITISNLPDETHRALEARAALHNRTPEAEMRAILEAALLSEKPVMLGTVLGEIGKKYDIFADEMNEIGTFHDKRNVEPMRFE
jgi:plasmid stability protein